MPTVFSKNRDRLLTQEVAWSLFRRVVARTPSFVSRGTLTALQEKDVSNQQRAIANARDSCGRNYLATPADRGWRGAGGVIAERASSFGDLGDLSEFTPKKPPAVPNREEVKAVAEQGDLISREPKKTPRKAQRRYRTGRTVQILCRVTPAVMSDIHALTGCDVLDASQEGALRAEIGTCAEWEARGDRCPTVAPTPVDSGRVQGRRGDSTRPGSQLLRPEIARSPWPSVS